MSSERTVNWVGEWLDALGLSEYAASFADNAIDRDVLPELTDADLKDLGVKLGHRRKLLRAIAALEAEADAPRSSSQPPGGTEAERRQLTIMFCDLVGSTALSQALDPEDLRELNRAYQDACKAAVDRYDGHIARYMGDGVLAYFGYPRAHEDDAERAIHAGFEAIAPYAESCHAKAHFSPADEIDRTDYTRCLEITSAADLNDGAKKAVAAAG